MKNILLIALFFSSASAFSDTVKGGGSVGSALDTYKCIQSTDISNTLEKQIQSSYGQTGLNQLITNVNNTCAAQAFLFYTTFFAKQKDGLKNQANLDVLKQVSRIDGPSQEMCSYAAFTYGQVRASVIFQARGCETTADIESFQRGLLSN